MSSLTVAAVWPRLAPDLPVADRDWMPAMLAYLERNSLWLATWTGEGEALVLELANDAERFTVPLSQLRAAWQGLRAGRALDWSSLNRRR